MKGAQHPKDKFKTLCYVEADISSAPYTSKFVETGNTGYRRNYDVILLVGLTELKAQVSWIDSRTVRAHIIHAYPFTSFGFRMRESRGKRKGLEQRFPSLSSPG